MPAYLTLVARMATLECIIFLFSACANQIPPTGGPKDIQPPLLIKVNPTNTSTQFATKKIQLNFNEYVVLDKVREQVIINPVPERTPDIVHRLRTVYITLRDTLEANTTYSIDFGNSIKDLNESNPFPPYRYVFATGTAVDSLTVSGRVVVAESGEPDSTLSVILHKSADDSAIVKERPRYATRLDSAGYFSFKNLPPGIFSIYAMKDEVSKRYFSKKQLLAFSDTRIDTREQPKAIRLFAFLEKDSNAIEEPAAQQLEKSKPSDSLKLLTTIDKSGVDLISPVELNFSAPVTMFDPARITLTDTAFNKIPGYHITFDTAKNKLAIHYPWREKTAYRILVDSSMAEDSLGRNLHRNDTIAFVTKSKSEYGTLKLKFAALALDKHPLLQFVQNNAVKFSRPLTSLHFYQELVPPGEYTLRIVYDVNQNGTWDTGRFFGTHRQPEYVQPIHTKLQIKPNWDNQLEIE